MRIKLLSTIAATAMIASFGSANAQHPPAPSQDNDVIDTDGNNNDPDVVDLDFQDNFQDNDDYSINDSGNTEAFTGADSDVVDIDDSGNTDNSVADSGNTEAFTGADSDVVDIDNSGNDNSQTDKSYTDNSGADNGAANNGGYVDGSQNAGDAAADNGSTAVDDQANQTGDGIQANDGGEIEQAVGGTNAANNGGEIDTDDSIYDNDAVANNGSTAIDDQATLGGNGNVANDDSEIEQANGGANAVVGEGSIDDNSAKDGSIVANDDSEVSVDQSDHSYRDNSTNSYSYDASFTLRIGDVQLNTASLSATVTGSSIGGGGLFREQSPLHPGDGASTGSITSDVSGNRGLISTNNNTGIGSFQSSQNVNVGTVNN